MSSIKAFDTSVILPTKNRLIYLRRAVDSVLSQTLLPKKIIIIDDCSDKCVSEQDFDDMEFKNVELSIIRNNSSVGGAACRNIGVMNSGTHFVSFLDDDDFWESDYLFNISNEMDSTSTNVATYASKRFVLSSSLSKVYRQVEAVHDFELIHLLRGNVVGTTSSVTVPRESILAVDGFDENLPAFQDYDLWVRLAINGIVFKPVRNAYIRYTISVLSNQISSNYNNHLLADKIMRKKYTLLLSSKDYFKLVKTLDFFVAKAIHRKNYLVSLKYSLKAVFLSHKPKAILMWVPYSILNRFGLYTS